MGTDKFLSFFLTVIYVCEEFIRFYVFLHISKIRATIVYPCLTLVLKLRGAHSFKRFTSRLLKVFFLSLCTFIPRLDVMLDFIWDQSTCQERVESDKIQNEKIVPTAGLELTTLRLEV